MTDHDISVRDLRAGLIDALRAARATEREIFAALDPDVRDAAPADGDWSPKDVQAHLSAWRRHQAERFAAHREGRPEPDVPATETDAANAAFHAQRAAWSWERVVADADAATEDLVTEIRAASDATITDDRMVQTTMGNGPEHDFGHLPAIADRVGLDDRVVALATDLEAAVGRGDWPGRSAAYARYNIACYHALAGRLDRARTLLRLALQAEASLRDWAPQDDDLIALRDELVDLGTPQA